MRISDLLADLPQSVRTLADADVGRAFQVDEILVEAVRLRLGALGLNEGAIVLCREQAPTKCVVRLEGGRSVRLPREWARCVRVEPATALVSRPD